MISKIRIVNFRQVQDEEIELGQAVVLSGPNNGGKTTLLQAVSLFAIAVRVWAVERANKNSKASRRTGVAITLEELLNIPIAEFRELWKDLVVREGSTNEEGKPIARNVRIQIHAEGYTIRQQASGASVESIPWKVGFEFDYARDSLIYARLTNDQSGNIYDFPEVLTSEQIGYLPSVSGLKPMEDKLERGSILRNIGNGNTSEVLRNLCYLLYDQEDKSKWMELVETIRSLFRVELNPPVYSSLTGLLKMDYSEGAKKNMDLSSLGSGTKQAILRFAYLLAFPNTVHLLDEPDAHLEVIRQSNVYDRISDIVKKNNSQLIVASHSESVLNRAFGKDQVISSVFGRFEQVNKKQVVASVLREYGYEEYLLASQKGAILYLEGTTDFDFLKAFSRKLGLQDLLSFLENGVYPYPVGKEDNRARKHFAALRAFIPELKGFALFDNLKKEADSQQDGLVIRQWSRNEVENYLPVPQSLKAYVQSLKMPLFEAEFDRILQDMTPPAALRNPDDSFWKTTKLSDDYLTPLFEAYFSKAARPPGTMDKSKYYQLVDFADPVLLPQEVKNLLADLQAHFLPGR